MKGLIYMWQEKLRIKKSNPIAGLYPFTKLWIALFFSVGAMILSGITVDGYPVYMVSSFLIVILLAITSGSLKKISKVLQSISIICILIILIQSLLVVSATVLTKINVFNLFNISVYKESLQYGLTLAFSVMCIGGILAWFFGVTDNKELIRALEKKGMGPKASYVLLSTLQMITVLQKSSKTIMSAQQARGVETEGNLFVRSKAFIPSMIPLILTSITSTEERVLTLESKGFLVKGTKTRLFDVLPNGKEKLAMTIAIVCFVLVVLWRVSLWVL